jgi:hypothetical protein
MGLRANLKQLAISNKTQDINSQCKIVVYDWATDALKLESQDVAALAQSTAMDISSQLVGATFSKVMTGPCGNFSFTLSNSPGFGSGDWKDLIKRGSWCVIYMSQEGELVLADQVGPPSKAAKKKEEAKKIRCIGFIDRVAVRSELNERGAFDITYEVSGRDFGVVYEDTSIWHNVFRFERIMLDSIATSQLNVTGTITLDKAIDLIHDLFYNPKAVPGAKVNSDESLVSIGLQWLMPRQLLNDVGFQVDSTPYWGELKGIKKLSPTEANLSVEKPTDYLSGNAWENLKKLSVPQFHELFTELNDSGHPQLIFRPIPFAIVKKDYPIVGKNIMFYKDVKSIKIDGINVIDFNVGEDNHARYNSFLVTLATSLIGIEDNIALLDGSGFPKNISDSIKRYGFRPMHTTVNSIIKNAMRADGSGNAAILREYNHVLYDYWNSAVFAESGEVELIGQNSVKLGKCMTFAENVPYVYGKRYYIEGYTDTFTVTERGAGLWLQSVMLTRGFEEKDLRTGSGFGTRNTPFTHQGEYTPAGNATGKKNRK